MLTTKHFKSLCSERAKFSFVTNWNAKLREKNVTEALQYNAEFNTERYLNDINLHKYRTP